MADPANKTPLGTPVVKTLLLTDYVDSTRFIERVGDVRASRVLARCDRVARDLLIKYGGQEIDKTDGFLFIFDRPIDAVRYALAFHQSLRDLEREVTFPLTARAGLHLGEVVLRENTQDDVDRGAKPIELEGLAKPTVARISSLAQSGQTLMTQSAFELALRASVGDPELPEDTQWLEHGDYLVKGIDDPIRVYEVGVEGVAPLAPPPNSEKVRRIAWSDKPADDSGGGRRAGLVVAAVLVLLVALGAVVAMSMQGSGEEPAEVASSAGTNGEANPGAAETNGGAAEAGDDGGEVANAQDPDAGAPTGDDEAKDEAPPTEPPAVTLSIKSTPEGAKVIYQGKVVGTTPLAMQMPPNPASYALNAGLDGHEDQVISCTVSQDDVAEGASVCAFEMEPERKAQVRPGASKGRDKKQQRRRRRRRTDDKKPNIHIIE